VLPATGRGIPPELLDRRGAVLAGIQLDEVAFPILLAWQLHEARALREFDPYPMCCAPPAT